MASKAKKVVVLKRSCEKKIKQCNFLAEFDKICFHEYTCEIFQHFELKWPRYALPHIGNWASFKYVELSCSFICVTSGLNMR